MRSAVVQVRSVADSSLVADAEELWHDAQHPLGPRARVDVMLALRKAARVWAPLVRLLHAAVPAGLALADEELEELLEAAATRLASAGVEVLWPRGLARDVTAKAVRRSRYPAAQMRSFFGGGQVLRFDWQLALGGTPLAQEELDRLAEAHRPIVRLRDQWVIVDPEIARKARAGRDRELPAIDALSAALTGTADIGGERVEVTSTLWLDELRRRIAEPDGGRDPVVQPPAMVGTLRDYQLRGLAGSTA